MPDLALGCLVKPFSEDDLVRALKAAEDIVRGRAAAVRPSRPGNLRLYAEEAARGRGRAARACCRRPDALERAAARLKARAGRVWRAAQLSFG